MNLQPEDKEKLWEIRLRAASREVRRKSQPPKKESARPRAMPSAQDDTLALLDLVERLVGEKTR